MAVLGGESNDLLCDTNWHAGLNVLSGNSKWQEKPNSIMACQESIKIWWKRHKRHAFAKVEWNS